MADEKSRKRSFIEISSSSESEFSSPDSYDDSVEITSSSSVCDDDDVDDDTAASEWIDSGDEDGDKDDVESMCDKVVRVIRGRSDLGELKLVECKAYLRRHGLRLSGTKDECIDRIKEHWRLKNGNGEALYPRSSFVIDCTGDVCKGDVVLFNQKVHQILNKRTRSRSLQRRTVAGRIVKESYGASKQQHTFTVEVLWSKGAKKLDPLTPLLVKGRNLYKMKTYRQRWKNEKERLGVLDEKHKRGAAARSIRALRHTKAATKKEKSSAYKGAKRRKHFHHLGPSRTSETNNEKNNSLDEHGKVLLVKNKKWNPPVRHLDPSRTRETIHEKSSLNEHGKALDKNKKWDTHLSSRPLQTSSSKQNPHRRHQNLVQTNQVRESQLLPYNISSQRFHHFQPDVFPRELNHFPPHRGPPSTYKFPYSHPHHDSDLKPIPELNDFSHGNSIGLGYSRSRSSHIPRNLNFYPGLMDNYPSYYSSTTDSPRWR